MARIPLIGGFYQAKSIIANAQRALNLYPEINPGDAPVPVTHYQRPGLVFLGSPPNTGVARCLYRATTGALYAIVGQDVFSISQSWEYELVGSLVDALTTPAVMADNGITAMIVDGSSHGYTITLGSNAFASVAAAGFYGGDFVQYVDTYFVLNKPDSPVMYISGSNDITFDALDFASKTGSPDNIVAVQIVHREVWLIGELATEVWANTGASDFTFGPIPGVYIEHGCCAPYSVAKQDLSIYWLSQDQQGHLLVIEGSGYRAQRISTHAIENELQSYGTFSDAIGFTYQVEGHTFYQLNFPTADKTWVYDVSTKLWHEQTWTDGDGAQHRHRGGFAAFAYGKNLMLDWETGELYGVDQNTYTDDGDPIVFLRSFPHMQQDGKRMFHRQFILDMDVGNAPDTMPDTEPMVSLRWSDTKGASWGNAVQVPLGAAGEYLTSMQAQRLGMARDRVYEVSWSVPYKTALNGAWLDLKESAT